MKFGTFKIPEKEIEKMERKWRKLFGLPKKKYICPQCSAEYLSAERDISIPLPSYDGCPKCLSTEVVLFRRRAKRVQAKTKLEEKKRGE